ncbi:DNA-damage-inducible protein D [Algoriphagus ratkowskyi]|uniref:DNA-damage-inducible protein D n=1 Tax=Algoriphagus ratkowskyi TaxID=57028 RepID=A0A2W7R118_9BACT|nr:hypothetical protein [Algoriphagus ratkowskyi]PZX54518.1 DNA-damage-inducible protein D [Algoriphagus ratkowskyi]
MIISTIIRFLPTIFQYYAQSKIEKEHIDNNTAVRDMLTKRGIVPENLLPAEDVKKLQRKLDGDEKKVLKATKKKK